MIRRRLFTVASATSLLLCLATVGLWVRTRSLTVVLVHYQWKHARWQAVLDHGRIGVNNQPQLDREQKRLQELNRQLYFTEVVEARAKEHLESHLHYLLLAPHILPGAQTRSLLEGVYLAERNRKHFETLLQAYVVTQPSHHDISLLLLATLAAMFPTTWLLSARRKTAVPGVCRVCGYNLSGNTSGVCPECGSPIPRKQEVGG